MTKLISIFLLLLVLLSEELIAQNYFYVHNNISQEEKLKMCDQMDYLSERLGMKDVTFAIIISRLPKSIEATTEYNYNDVVQRKMILFRINKKLPQHAIAQVIAHEMVHAFQFYSQDLIRHNRTTFVYKNKKYDNINKIPHQQRPWEIEALHHAPLLNDDYIRFKNAQSHLSTQTRNVLK